MRPPEELISYLRNNDNFLLSIHIDPDGDALGSILALGEALSPVGKRVIMHSRDRIPVHYAFLPESNLIIHSLNTCPGDIPALILIDCNSPQRAEVDPIHFAYSIVIDHHATVNHFGDIRWIVPDAPATGLLIYYLIDSMGIPLTETMATNLYTAIAADTGTFRYSNTNAETFHVSAQLIDAGADPSYISNKLYNTWSRSRFDLLTHFLTSLEIVDSVAIITATKDIIRDRGALPEDTKNFVDFPKMMESICISVLFREVGHDLWKVSLRSKGSFDVARVAAEFGGGGHRNAAGFRVNTDIESVKKKLLHYLSRITSQRI